MVYEWLHVNFQLSAEKSIRFKTFPWVVTRWIVQTSELHTFPGIRVRLEFKSLLRFNILTMHRCKCIKLAVKITVQLCQSAHSVFFVKWFRRNCFLQRDYLLHIRSTISLTNCACRFFSSADRTLPLECLSVAYIPLLSLYWVSITKRCSNVVSNKIKNFLHPTFSQQIQLIFLPLIFILSHFSHFYVDATAFDIFRCFYDSCYSSQFTSS